MFGFPFLSDAPRHALQFPARAFDLPLRLFLLRIVHLRQSFREPPAGAAQNGGRHLQVALDSGRSRSGRCLLPLRLQKQFRLGEDALADHARTIPPGGIELSGLARIATVLRECGGHPRAVSALTRAMGTRYFIATCAVIAPSRTCCWMASGSSSTSANRRDTQLTLRSKRRANSSSVGDHLKT
jgi:hypothetical protein